MTDEIMKQCKTFWPCIFQTYICVPLVWLVSTGWIIGQESLFSFLSPPVRNFTPENYQAQYQNWNIAQSDQGWIYVANNSGLLEFDGMKWQLYPLPQRQPARTVHIGPDGRVLVGGFEFIGELESPDIGQKALVNIVNEEASGLTKEEIWHAVQREKVTYLQSFSMIYEWSGSSIQSILPPTNLMFIQDVNGSLIFQAIDGGLYELTRDKSFVALPRSEGLSDKTVAFILPWTDLQWLIGTNSHGAFLYSAKDGLSNWDSPVNRALKSSQLNKGLRLSTGYYTFGTISDGVYVTDSLGGLLYHLNKDSGLQNNTVLSMMEDSDQNLWVGLDKGVDMIALSSPLRYFSDLSGQIGTVYTAAIHKDVLYIGSNQGVFYAPIQSANLRHTINAFKLVEGTQGQVWRLLKIKGELLCGHNNGTYKIEGHKSQRISDIKGGWDFSEVQWDDNKLIQSVYSGLVRYDFTPDKGWQLGGRINGFSEAVKQVKLDSNRQFWAIHPQRGLFKLKLNKACDQVLEWKTYGEDQGLNSDYQLAFIHWNDDIIVKSDCYYRYDEKRDRFMCISKEEGGKWDNSSSWIFGSDSLWFYRDNIDFWLGQGDQMIRQFDVRLVPKYENIIEEPTLNGGVFLFCQVNGFSVFRRSMLNSLKKQDHTHPITFKSVRAYSRDGHGIYLNLNGYPELKSNMNNLNFELAQALFTRPPNIEYRLENLHEDWLPLPVSSGTISLQNLKSGEYTLHVRSSDQLYALSYAFTILNPWYLSKWAVVLYALLFILMIYMLYRYLDYRIRKEREAFEKRRKEEARLLKERESRRQLEREVELKSRELAHSAMTIVRKNEVLYELKNNLKSLLKKDDKSKDIIRMLDEHLESEQDWESFVEVFNNVHDDFFKKLQVRFGKLTPGDLKLAAYLRLNLSTKEIAPLLNISVRGVENKRYRLRKKMNLPDDVNLTEFMINF